MSNEKTKSPYYITEEQLDAWKKKHGEDSILKIELRGEVVYILDPEKSKNYFHMAKRALQFTLQNDLLSAGEVVFNECYLGGLGDKNTIDTNNPIYANLCLKSAELVSVSEGAFTKA